MAGLTDSLSRFAYDPGFTSLPASVGTIIKTGFTDTIATMIAGRQAEPARILRQFVRQRQAQACEARVLFLEERVASSDAALINGTAAHALDYDDVALGGHPSTVLVPAILAEAERLDASGADAMRAYLVGYEIWAELFRREPDPYHLKGWHPTAVLGTVGAAGAVAWLNGLSAEQCRHAIALSASMACGLVANFGTMTKPLHAGRAASNAIDAVRLASIGLTAAPDAIEHHAGYLAALSPKGAADLSGDVEIGKRLRILESGLSIKKYPVCYSTHRVTDGVLDLVKEHGIRPDEVAAVDATIGVSQASMLRNHSPSTGLEAKFSLEFSVAAALSSQQVGLAELTDDYVNRPDIRELMTKVRIHTSDSRCPIEPVFALNDQVAITLKDGTRLNSGDIRFARGNASLPLQNEELKAKFVDCCAGAGLDANRLHGQLGNLENLASVRELITTNELAAA